MMGDSGREARRKRSRVWYKKDTGRNGAVLVGRNKGGLGECGDNALQ